MALLRLSALRPGDIILTARKTAVSKLIAVSTTGKYSHASLVLSNSLVFEATTDGLGFSPIEIAGVDKEELIGELPEVSKLTVLRPRLTDHIPPAELAMQLFSASSLYCGWQYPSFEELLSTSSILKNITSIRRLVEKLDDKRHLSEICGPYCSKLILEIFEKINYPLIKGSNDDLSPNRLLKLDVNPVDVEFKKVERLQSDDYVAEYRSLQNRASNYTHKRSSGLIESIYRTDSIMENMMDYLFSEEEKAEIYASVSHDIDNDRDVKKENRFPGDRLSSKFYAYYLSTDWMIWQEKGLPYGDIDLLISNFFDVYD